MLACYLYLVSHNKVIEPEKFQRLKPNVPNISHANALLLTCLYITLRAALHVIILQV